MNDYAHACHIRLSAEERELDCLVQSVIFEKLADGLMTSYECGQPPKPKPLHQLLGDVQCLKIKATSDASVVEALDRWRLCLRARIVGRPSESACIVFYLLAMPRCAAKDARLLAFDGSGRTYILNAPAPSAWPDEDDFIDVPISHITVLGSSQLCAAAIGYLPAKYGTVDWRLVDDRHYLSYPVLCWTTGALIGFTAISLVLVEYGKASFDISTGIAVLLIMACCGFLVLSGWLTMRDRPVPRKTSHKLPLIGHLCTTLLACFLLGRYARDGWLNPRTIISLVMLILAIVFGTLLILFRNAAYEGPERIDWSQENPAMREKSPGPKDCPGI